MAKRAAPDEKPYRPLLDPELMSAALAQGMSNTSAPSQKVVDLPRSEPARRPEPLRVAAQEAAPKPPDTSFQPQTQAVQPFAEKFDQEKRILFTRTETQAIDRLVTSLAMRLNAQVKVSHLIRGLVALLLNAESDIHRRAGETGPLVRPPNGDAQALQRFERDIAKIVGAAITDSGPLR
jgi:hypothetical protein